MPAPKKFWIFDGSVEQYPTVLSGGSVHMGKSCVDCHGGDASKNTRAEAHTNGFKAIPGGGECQTCHSAIAAGSEGSLHTTVNGYPGILAARGWDAGNAEAKARYDVQCAKCHVANAEDQAACGHCHVSVPNQAGGGLLKGHAFQETPSQDNNCTACHGSRVKDEYYGQNNPLLTRNKAVFAEDSPWKAETFSLQPDVHKTKGMDCLDCHSADEMHGEGTPAEGDRYDVDSAPVCDDCHGPGKTDAAAFSGVSLHTAGHIEVMECQVCHSQPYKNCFSCHTDVTEEGVPFFKTNGGDPTLEARKAASADPTKVTPDALMTFRAGKNPRWTGESDSEEKQYSLLRHVPVDSDTLSYKGVNLLEGLIPDMAALPTWKQATPHNIQRQTEITKSCSNCHGAGFDMFWLTDPIAAADGWISPDYLAEEEAANDGLALEAPLPMK